MDTYFAPAQRTERWKFKNQIANISQNPLMDTLLKAAAGLLVVLNEDRQIVAINHAFLQKLDQEKAEEVLGLRLGESLGCVHAFKQPGGCGTTEACMSCGAAIAMMAAITDDRTNEQVCALLSDKNGTISDTCLLIKAHPVKIDDNRWILIYAQDITRQQFWGSLEQVFFHDISNILTSLSGNAELLKYHQPENKKITALKNGIERLIREVQMQKAFSRHKQDGIHVRQETVPLKKIRKETHLFFKGHVSTGTINFAETWPDETLVIRTDVILASRVLGNMIINAFEASDSDDEVRLDTIVTDDQIRWEVWNKTMIPPEIRVRVFQRHFSTKSGPGRGMGTYAMKLFGESCLKGKVSFSSLEGHGTCFAFSLPR